MNDDKKINACVHKMPNIGQHQIHKQYGLWLFSSSSGKTPSDTFKTCAPRYFEFYSISHMYSGCGRLWLEPDFEHEVNAGECIVITPGTLNRYAGAPEGPYVEDSINFCGPVADMLMRSGIIVNGIFPMGGIRRLLPIMELMRDPAMNSQIKANIEFQKLLVDIYLEKCSSVQEEYPLLEKLLNHIKANPQKWWTVNEMAELCNLSCDQMRRVFFNRTGVNPKLYVDRLKLNKAAEMLSNTKCSVVEIAEQFGYLDQYHFSRRFKCLIGMSPTHYRESVINRRNS